MELELESVLAAAGASAALAGIFLLTVVAVLSTWRLSHDIRRGQQDLLHLYGRIEGLVTALSPERVTAAPQEERAAAAAPAEFSRQLTSVSEQIQNLREGVKALSESRASEFQEVAQAAGEMQSTLKRLESAVALMADGVAAFIQKLENGRGRT